MEMHFRREHVLTLSEHSQNVILFQELQSCIQQTKRGFAVKSHSIDVITAGCLYFLWRFKFMCQPRDSLLEGAAVHFQSRGVKEMMLT